MRERIWKKDAALVNHQNSKLLPARRPLSGPELLALNAP